MFNLHRLPYRATTKPRSCRALPSCSVMMRLFEEWSTSFVFGAATTPIDLCGLPILISGARVLALRCCELRRR